MRVPGQNIKATLDYNLVQSLLVPWWRAQLGTEHQRSVAIFVLWHRVSPGFQEALNDGRRHMPGKPRNSAFGALTMSTTSGS